ncbi:MAG: endonuclease/exonuclease/phosphatase family protein [Kiritimatiellae bacterium]|nr:endonuclease/exonuclease/phosphatase family protein [Kiritimatiellia bacterium]
MTFSSAFLVAAVTVGSWNGKWFPSGRAEHRAPPHIEARTVAKAGAMLREGLDKADPYGTNDVIICLNEMRGPKVVNELIAAIGRTNLTCAVITAYRRRDRFDMQQDAILTTLPVVAANWSKWKNHKAETPPRGYAHATVVFPGAITTEVYSVHLKSNYGQTDEKTARLNRAKRSHAIRQLIEQERPRRGRKNVPVIIAGDLNADKWSKDFKEDEIFEILSDAGFITPLEFLSPEKRITYPKRGKWGGTALDYIFIRGLRISSGARVQIISAGEISDHDAVFINVE